MSKQHPFLQTKQTAQESIYDAQKIAFAPMTFQAVRIAWKRGLLKALDKSKTGLTPKELTLFVKTDVVLTSSNVFQFFFIKKPVEYINILNGS